MCSAHLVVRPRAAKGRREEAWGRRPVGERDGAHPASGLGGRGDAEPKGHGEDLEGLASATTVLDLRTRARVSLRVALQELRRQGHPAPREAIAQLVAGGRVGPFRALTDEPPTVAEIMAITGASYASAYRWTTGRSRFPLDAFLAVVLARGVDLKTATVWAEEWLGVNLEAGITPGSD